MASLITTEKLSKTFSRKGSQHHVLKNIDLEIDGADFTVVMGPSGAGKSTLLYALSGMDRPSLGRIVFDGQNIEKMSEDKLARFRLDHCGFVFQQVYLLDSLSVSDNVLAVGLLGSRRRREIVERAGELFDRVGLPERTRVAAATTLSGGEAGDFGSVRRVYLVNQRALPDGGAVGECCACGLISRIGKARALPGAALNHHGKAEFLQLGNGGGGTGNAGFASEGFFGDAYVHRLVLLYG